MKYRKFIVKEYIWLHKFKCKDCNGRFFPEPIKKQRKAAALEEKSRVSQTQWNQGSLVELTPPTKVMSS